MQDLLKIGSHLWAIYIGINLIYVEPTDIGVTELRDISHVAEISIFSIFKAITEIGQFFYRENPQNSHTEPSSSLTDKVAYSR